MIPKDSVDFRGIEPLNQRRGYPSPPSRARLLAPLKPHFGELVGVSDRTVRKRLSDDYRDKKGLNPVIKKQAAIQQEDGPQNWSKLSRDLYDSGEEKQAKEARRTFNAVDPFSGKYSAYRAECNIYCLDVEVVPKRFLRKAYNHLSTSFGRVDQALSSEREVFGKEEGSKMLLAIK